MADVNESAKSDMSWIDIAVLGQKRGVVIVDYAPGWSDFMDELHFADAIDGNEPDHLTPGAYRWTGFTIGSWQEGDRCVVKGGTFTRAAPPAMDREAVACPTCGDTSPLEECATCGAYPTRTTTLSADAIRQGEGWRIEDGKPITDAPYACHVLAGRLDHDTGEWIMAVVASPPIYPFTHWWSLPDLPATPASHASDGGKA